VQITLRKITKTPLDFEIKSNEITFKGYLQYHTGKLILLHANLKGVVDTECSQCGDDLRLSVDDTIEFFVSDGLYDGDDIDLDVVESFDSTANLDDLLVSELELIKSDYHSCKNCK
jgi:uncharacterized metal-binding protein YceD (DUF177 family)